MRVPSIARAVLRAGVFLMLFACGGGGSGEGLRPFSPPPSHHPLTGVGSGLSLATHSVAFSVNNRDAIPQSQLIVTTLDYTGSGTPYFKVEVSGDEKLVRAYTTVTNGTGQTWITPELISSRNPGTSTNIVKISVCIDDPNCANNRLLGSPQTVNVSYRITPSVQGNTVSPKVAPHSDGVGDLHGALTGAVFLRGRGAASINGGAMSFSGKLTAIHAPVFRRTSLAYPVRPQEIMGMVYDAERALVFVAARYSQRTDDQLIKFSYNGTDWSAPASMMIADIRDVVLSPDGGKLLVATGQSIIEFDPETLLALGAYRPTDSEITSGTLRLHQLASANDGYISITTTGGPDSGAFVYLYSVADHSFTRTDFVTRNRFGTLPNTTRAVAHEYRDVGARAEIPLEPDTSVVFMARMPNAAQAFIAGVSGVEVVNLL